MEAEQVVPPVSGDVVGPGLRLQGVRGWLLFFCITLVVLNPLASLFTFGLSLSQVSPALNRLPGLLVVAITDGLVSLALMALSVFAGVSLWRVRHNAVKWARTFLFAGVAYVLISPLFIFLAGLPAALVVQALPNSYLSAGRSLVYYVIWLSYLARSKRVQATYVQQPPAEQALQPDAQTSALDWKS